MQQRLVLDQTREIYQLNFRMFWARSTNSHAPRAQPRANQGETFTITRADGLDVQAPMNVIEDWVPHCPEEPPMRGAASCTKTYTGCVKKNQHQDFYQDQTQTEMELHLINPNPDRKQLIIVDNPPQAKKKTGCCTIL